MKKTLVFIFALSTVLSVSCMGRNLAKYSFDATNASARVSFILSTNASFVDQTRVLAYRLHGSILSNADVTNISLKYCESGKDDKGKLIYSPVANKITINDATSSNLISRLRKIPDVSALSSLPEFGELLVLLNRPFLFPVSGEKALTIAQPSPKLTSEEKKLIAIHKKWLSYASQDEYGKIIWVLRDYGHPKKVINQALEEYKNYDASFKATYHRVYSRRMRRRYYRGSEIGAILVKISRPKETNNE